MKNKFKKALPLLLLLMVPLSIYAAMNWEGSDNVTNIKDNLDSIQLKIDNLKTESGDKDQTIEQIEELLKNEKELRQGKEDEIKDLLAEIEELEQTQNASGKQQRINELEAENLKLISDKETLQADNTRLAGENTDLSAKLDQALKDVQEIEAITDKMVNQ